MIPRRFSIAVIVTLSHILKILLQVAEVLWCFSTFTCRFNYGICNKWTPRYKELIKRHIFYHLILHISSWFDTQNHFYLKYPVYENQWSLAKHRVSILHSIYPTWFILELNLHTLDIDGSLRKVWFSTDLFKHTTTHHLTVKRKWHGDVESFKELIALNKNQIMNWFSHSNPFLFHDMCVYVLP